MGGIVEHSFNCAGVDTSAMSIKDSLPLLELCVVPWTTFVNENMHEAGEFGVQGVEGLY